MIRITNHKWKNDQWSADHWSFFPQKWSVDYLFFLLGSCPFLSLSSRTRIESRREREDEIKTNAQTQPSAADDDRTTRTACRLCPLDWNPGRTNLMLRCSCSCHRCVCSVHTFCPAYGLRRWLSKGCNIERQTKITNNPNRPQWK